MAVKHIYICDKCGHEQSDTNQFWTVGVTANHATCPKEEFVDGKFMQVCRPCLESFGIHVRHKQKDETPPPIPTVEDLIRDLVRRCM